MLLHCIGCAVYIIVFIILVGLGQDSILSAVHPDAPALFNVDTSLERVNYTYYVPLTALLVLVIILRLLREIQCMVSSI